MYSLPVTSETKEALKRALFVLASYPHSGVEGTNVVISSWCIIATMSL